MEEEITSNPDITPVTHPHPLSHHEVAHENDYQTEQIALATHQDTTPQQVAKATVSLPVPFPIIVSPLIICLQVVGITIVSNIILSGMIFFLGYFVDLTMLATGTSIALVLNIVRATFFLYLICDIITRNLSVVYFVRDGHLVRQKGTMDISETAYSMNDLKQVRIFQDTLGRLGNYGTVILTFRVALDPVELSLVGVQKPQQVAAMFTPYV